MTKLTSFANKLTLAITLMALLSSPFGVLAQSTTSETDESARRKEAAAILKAESEARKAAADAALVEAQIAEKNATTRRTQLELLKSNSEVTGSPAENGIAASKAIGCAAVSISNEVHRINEKPASDAGKITALVLYSPSVADLMTQYSALFGEVSTMNKKYVDSIAGLNKKLDQIEGRPPSAGSIRLKFLIEERDKIELGAKYQKNAAGVLEFKEFSQSEIDSLVAPMNQKIEALQASEKKLAVAGIEPVSAALGVALDLFALFKTDTSVVGTEIKPGSMDMTGYLFRLISLQANQDGRVLSRPNSIRFLSPDHFVLTSQDYSKSDLIQNLDKLSEYYQYGKGASERATSLRKKAIETAKINQMVDANERQVKATTVRVENALKAWAAKPNSSVFEELYKKELKSLSTAQTSLDAANNRVAQEVETKFEVKVRAELKSVERMNTQAEKLSNRFSDTSDSPTAPKKLIGDFLKGEAIVREMNKVGTRWLETSVTSAGANQRKQSSPIFDVFTRGPVLTYSGGAVVTYQIRNLDSTIMTAGTVWAHAPYKRSKNIEKFTCTGIDTGSDPERRYKL